MVGNNEELRNRREDREKQKDVMVCEIMKRDLFTVFSQAFL